jgi:hypothetical protein
VTTVVLNLITIEANNDCQVLFCKQSSMVKKVRKRRSAIRPAGRKARQLNLAIESHSAMAQVEQLVPPKHPETG